MSGPLNIEKLYQTRLEDMSINDLQQELEEAEDSDSPSAKNAVQLIEVELEKRGE